MKSVKYFTVFLRYVCHPLRLRARTAARRIVVGQSPGSSHLSSLAGRVRRTAAHQGRVSVPVSPTRPLDRVQPLHLVIPLTKTQVKRLGGVSGAPAVFGGVPATASWSAGAPGTGCRQRQSTPDALRRGLQPDPPGSPEASLSSAVWYSGVVLHLHQTCGNYTLENRKGPLMRTFSK